MKTISFSLNDKDYSLLSRIAKADHRRLKDLVYLSLGAGLDYVFCENHVVVEKKDDEYTQEEVEQRSKNEELAKSEGWNALSYEEQKEKGLKHVRPYLSNHERKEDGSGYHDPLIDPLAERIKNYALENDV
tara:strand:+ start:305 stop:697 length:393 start_codon:yes stop_codon:yes gene_type:complete